MNRLSNVIAIVLGLLVALPMALAQPVLPLAQLQLPAGFTITVLARVPNAREMALGEGRVLYVGSAGAGRVVALELDGAYAVTRTRVVAQDLQLPIGVAFHDGDLYVSAVGRILRYPDIGHHLDAPPKPIVVRADLPAETHHGGRFLAFGPDGWLYVPIGAPCNICEPDPDRYAAILRMRPDGSGLETFARGVRNTVGFDWHPQTRELWFTDNGRDALGDDAPPDELNRAARPGLHFGYPYCHGGTLADPDFGQKRACDEFVAPAQRLGAHVAALGMRFYAGSQFPAAYRGRVFIAEHGSWNRSRKVGYRISTVTLAGDRATAYEPFITGWLQGESAWGRPSDLLVLPDGSLLVADDLAGAIYRVTYDAAGAR
jgi:glucose/arabinose dehydrogenase